MKTLYFTILCILLSTMAFSQDNIQVEQQDAFHRHHIASSPWMLYNFAEDGADYYILNYGYQLTQKDVVFVEAFTWKYSEPMGSYGDSDEMYPGKIRSFGIGAGYQRFLWKKLFATVEATPLMLQYHDADDKKFQKGFQLYCQLMTGYRFEFFNKRWFIEPAYSLKYWPINTNVPKSFADIDEGTPKYIFEPSLNIGFRF
jgi:hypothetical protein